ncbi:MAG: ABC transporter ATP-binding protein [Desulfobulbaceae bacterium]|nr:MAG: ABC transporter ATP-binding protein [Desulfobulbaceae bacterium]
MIRLEDAEKWYNRGEFNEVHALKKASLSVAPGEVVCVTGPSGSGKSTLLSLIGCVFPPTSGLVEVGGRKLSRLPDRFLTMHRQKVIGFIFQQFRLLPGQSVLDNIVLPLLPQGIPPAVQKQIAASLMERLSITARKDFPVDKISGGEQQRVAIARALVNNPAIILADEPTAHLDEQLSREFLAIVGELKRDGKTVVITSHDQRVTTDKVVDRVVEIVDGRIGSRDGNGYAH